MTFYPGHSRFLRIYDDEERGLQEIVRAVNYYLSAGESRGDTQPPRVMGQLRDEIISFFSGGAYAKLGLTSGPLSRSNSHVDVSACQSVDAPAAPNRLRDQFAAIAVTFLRADRVNYGTDPSR